MGCGTIGSELARACQSKIRNVELAAICDIDEEKARLLQLSLKKKVPVLKIDGLIKKAKFVVEAAGAKISPVVLKKAIERKKDIMIMSIGGLIGNESLLKKADGAGVKVYLPSGAICGIDGLKSASVGKIDSVMLTTKKSPKSLVGAPYLKEKNIDVWGIKEETVIFDGSAKEAVKGFPQNVNVCAILSLAGLGAEKTRVRIVTSPSFTKNMHEVEVKGEFGSLMTRTENVPSKTNPKTSQLAAFSAIATLEGAVKNLKMGT